MGQHQKVFVEQKCYIDKNLDTDKVMADRDIETEDTDTVMADMAMATVSKHHRRPKNFMVSLQSPNLSLVAWPADTDMVTMYMAFCSCLNKISQNLQQSGWIFGELSKNPWQNLQE